MRHGSALPLLALHSEREVRMPYASDTRIVVCEHCGALNRALITFYDRPKDNDWDDGTCTRCATPVISERCGSISMMAVEPESLERQGVTRRAL